VHSGIAVIRYYQPLSQGQNIDKPINLKKSLGKEDRSLTSLWNVLKYHIFKWNNNKQQQGNLLPSMFLSCCLCQLVIVNIVLITDLCINIVLNIMYVFHIW